MDHNQPASRPYVKRPPSSIPRWLTYNRRSIQDKTYQIINPTATDKVLPSCVRCITNDFDLAQSSVCLLPRDWLTNSSLSHHLSERHSIHCFRYSNRPGGDSVMAPWISTSAGPDLYFLLSCSLRSAINLVNTAARRFFRLPGKINIPLYHSALKAPLPYNWPRMHTLCNKLLSTLRA